MLEQQQAVDFLRELVTVPSTSGSEQLAVRLLVERMRALGLDAHVDGAGNAVGMRGGPTDGIGKRSEILLLGHIDTVPGEIDVQIENGKLYGRGTVDAKGPLAAFLYAAARAELHPGTRLVVIGAVEEESATSKGARQVARDFSPNYCIIGEPSGWDSVTLGYKGRLLIDCVARRPMSHTAGPQPGVSELIINWWNCLSEYCSIQNDERQRLFDRLLPSIRYLHTESDGLFDTAYLKAGLRLPLDFDLRSFEKAACQWEPGTELSYYGYEPAYKEGRRSPLAAMFQQVLRETGMRPRQKLKTGTSDMNVVGPIWRCPIVAYGPGDSSLDHTPQEHIDLEEFWRAVLILEQVLSRLSGL